MKTLRLAIDASDVNSAASRNIIENAAAILRNGGTVAFPTETVYGLGANALVADAVQKIFIAKQRPQWDPLIVHIAGTKMLHKVASAVSANTQALMDAFWPGPLTLLLPRSNRVPGLVTAGRPLVGVRMPAHPVAVAMIRAAGVPIAAPSANTFGGVSPTLPLHVLEDLDGLIDAVLDAGETQLGLESAVVDASGETPILYRPGVISLEQIRSVCPASIPFEEKLLLHDRRLDSLPAPGVGLRHYAPRGRLLLVDLPDSQNEQQRSVFDKAVDAALKAASETAARVGIMLPQEFSGEEAIKGLSSSLAYPWGRWSKPEELAQRLFAGLRALDAAGADIIICPLPPAAGVGAAIRDRLLKAALPH